MPPLEIVCGRCRRRLFESGLLTYRSFGSPQRGLALRDLVTDRRSLETSAFETEPDYGCQDQEA